MSSDGNPSTAIGEVQVRLISAMMEPCGDFGVAYELMDASSEDEAEDDISSLSSNDGVVVVDVPISFLL